MTVHTKVGGSWQEVNLLFAKLSGTWTEMEDAWVKENGVWKQAQGRIRASGGLVSDANGMRFHTFNSSGTLTITEGSGNIYGLWRSGGSSGGPGIISYANYAESYVQGGTGGGSGVATKRIIGNVPVGSYSITVSAAGSFNDQAEAFMSQMPSGNISYRDYFFANQRSGGAGAIVNLAGFSQYLNHASNGLDGYQDLDTFRGEPMSYLFNATYINGGSGGGGGSYSNNAYGITSFGDRGFGGNSGGGAGGTAGLGFANPGSSALQNSGAGGGGGGASYDSSSNFFGQASGGFGASGQVILAYKI